jgi:hypothetical protein
MTDTAPDTPEMEEPDLPTGEAIWADYHAALDPENTDVPGPETWLVDDTLEEPAAEEDR